MVYFSDMCHFPLRNATQRHAAPTRIGARWVPQRVPGPEDVEDGV